MEKISSPVRILAIVIVLVGVAGLLAMRMLGPSAADETSAAPVATHTPAKLKPAKTKPAKQIKTARAPAKAGAATPALNAPKPAAKPAAPATGFPVAVDKLLARHEVVVVSLVVPGARVDELAAAEAQAGAKLGGAGYLALNVLNEDVARSLLSKLDVVEDPSVLVLKRSGEVALELAGFVDRETVAQAAANASP